MAELGEQNRMPRKLKLKGTKRSKHHFSPIPNTMESMMTIDTMTTKSSLESIVLNEGSLVENREEFCDGASDSPRVISSISDVEPLENAPNLPDDASFTALADHIRMQVDGKQPYNPEPLRQRLAAAAQIHSSHWRCDTPNGVFRTNNRTLLQDKGVDAEEIPLLGKAESTPKCSHCQYGIASTVALGRHTGVPTSKLASSRTTIRRPYRQAREFRPRPWKSVFETICLPVTLPYRGLKWIYLETTDGFNQKRGR